MISKVELGSERSRLIVAKSFEELSNYLGISHKQRAIVEEENKPLVEYIYLDGEWIRLTSILPSVDPQTIIKTSFAELNVTAGEELQRGVVIDGVNQPKEFIYHQGEWVVLTNDPPKLPPELKVVQTYDELEALVDVEEEQRAVVLGDENNKVTEYIYVNGAWELFVDSDEEVSELLVFDTLDALLATSDVKNEQRAVLYIEEKDFAEEYIYLNGEWVKTSSSPVEQPKFFVVVQSVEEMRALPSPQIEQRVIVHNEENDYAEEFVYLGGEWVQTSSKPQELPKSYEIVDDLTTITEPVEEQRVVVNDGSEKLSEYIYLNSQWRVFDSTIPQRIPKFYVVNSVDELSEITDFENGDKAFNKGNAAEYVAVEGQWLPVFTTGAISIDATMVTTSDSLQFISKTQKDQIEANQVAINSVRLALETLENKVDALDIIDGNDKVSLTGTDTADYLINKIGATLEIVNDVLEVKSLIGQDVSIDELNLLKGVQSNVQEQINSLIRVGNFPGATETKAELDLITEVPVNSMMIVLADETRGGVSTVYMHNGETWNFTGEFKIDLRDFVANPISLTQEVSGVLPKGNYELPSARDIKVDDVQNHFTNDNVEAALEETATKLQSAASEIEELKDAMSDLNGKEVKSVDYHPQLPLVGDTDVLYIVWEDNTNSNKTSLYLWNPLESAYKLIISSSVSGKAQEYEQQTKLGVVATASSPQVFAITIAQTNDFLRGPINVLKFTGGSNNVTLTQMSFDVSDATSFEEALNVVFDGKAYNRTLFEVEATINDNHNGNGVVYEMIIDKDMYGKMEKIEVEEK